VPALKDDKCRQADTAKEVEGFRVLLQEWRLRKLRVV
jgi:hypothetical protein